MCELRLRQESSGVGMRLQESNYRVQARKQATQSQVIEVAVIDRSWVWSPGEVVRVAVRVLPSWRSTSWRESNQRKHGAPTARQWTTSQIALGTQFPRIIAHLSVAR